MKKARALEQLRQEREAFDQAKGQGALWFSYKLRMGYGINLLLLGVAAACTYILLRHDDYPAHVVTIVAATLLGDMITLAIAVFKLVLQNNQLPAVQPTTRIKDG